MEDVKKYNVLIRPEGQIQIIEHDDSLDFYRSYINGFIEIVRVHDDVVMIIDDEGKIKDLPVNILASWLYNCEDYIVGPAILDKRAGPELIGLTHPEAIAEVMKLVRVMGESIIMEEEMI